MTSLMRTFPPLLLLTLCLTSPVTAQGQGSTPSPSDRSGHDASGIPLRTLYRGTLTQVEDRLLLAPCGGGRTVRVRDVSPEVIITAALTDIGFDRYRRLHLEAWGRMRDGELWIDRLNRAGVEMGCGNTGFGLRAQGNEPGWQVETRDREVRLTRLGEAPLRAPPVALAWHWTQSSQHRPEGHLSVQTESARWHLQMAPRLCRDTMADAVYGLTATLSVQAPQPAGTYKGCAFLGTERMP